MKKITFVLSANAGVSMIYDDIKILVDTFHNEKTKAFSTISDDLADRLFANPDFGDADYLIYTHNHPDHYSKELTERYTKSYPGTIIIKPWEQSPTSIKDEKNGLRIDFLPLTHEGELHKDVPHYGLFLNIDGHTVLFTGDAAVASDEITDKLCESHIDLAVLDFPWLTLKKGRDFIMKKLNPDHILINHLPFISEDKNDFIGYAKKYAGQLNHPDLKMISESFSKAEFILM